MKTKLKVKKLYLIGLLIAVGSGVVHLDWKEMPEAEEPQLLDRPLRVQMGAEWERVQRQWDELVSALGTNAGDHKSSLLLAELCVNEARVTGEHGHYYPLALELTKKVIDQAVDQDLLFYALTLQSGVQLSLHDFAQAKTTALKAQALNGYNAQIYGVLTDCYVELGEYDKAIQMADRMMAIRPDLRSYSRVAYLREIFGQFEPAVQAMEMAIAAGPPGGEETAWAMLTLADLYLEYGDAENAEVWYQRILKVRPDYPFAVAGLAKVHWHNGDFEKAEAKFQRAMAIIPEVGFFMDLALMRKSLNQPNEELLTAISYMLADDVEAGHSMNLEYAQVHLDLLNDPRSALSYVLHERSIRPHNIDVNFMLAKIYHQLDQDDQARKHLLLAKATDSQDPELYQLEQSLITG